jgi:hypothetical protein
MPTITIRHKRGATLSYAGLVADSSDVPIDLTGYTVTCELRDASLTLASAATVTMLDQVTDPGRFTITVPAASTETWTAGRALRMDVRIESPSRVDYTDTWLIDVVERITE